jgi:hypothetical protein
LWKANSLKKLDAWIGGATSSGGRLTLVDACLSNLPSYVMSMFLLNKTFIEKLDKHRRRFFWHGKKQKKGYYMVKWTRVCRSKKKGGLGVKDLRKQNISLLCKWWWKLDTLDGLWQKIVKAKYLRNKTVATVTSRFNDSPCWKSILKVKDTYLAGRMVMLKNGNITRLWKDSIMGEQPFCDQFPVLFNLCQVQDCTIKSCREANFVIPFRRRLRGELMDHWQYILNILLSVPPCEDDDKIAWSLNKNTVFSTRSVYTLLEKPLAGSNNKWIWKAKMPLKIKIFMWQLCQDAVLTRENMKKRKWPGSPTCSFCRQVESNDHIFFTCNTSRVVWGVLASAMGVRCVPNSFWQAMAWLHAYFPGFERFYTIIIAAICWAIWNVRNKITFDKHILRSPSEISYFAVALIVYWTGLQKPEDKSYLSEGAKKMAQAAAAVYSRRATTSPNQTQMLLIKGA